jgi:hypothetical protein
MYKSAGIAALERICRPRAGCLAMQDPPWPSASIPPPGVRLHFLPGLSWAYDRPSTESYSWLFVPLILAAMGDIQHEGLMEFAAGRRWQTWVWMHTEKTSIPAASPSSLSTSTDQTTYAAGTRNAFYTRLQPEAKPARGNLCVAMRVCSLYL